MNEEMSRVLLSEAHERSTSALSKIEGHERLCDERYKGIAGHLFDIKENQKQINARMWSISGVIITLLLSILGYLLVKGVDHVFAEAFRSALTIALFGDIT